MRQKSKQQAKIEATQKLEQVKNEQLQQQQQQLPSISQSEEDSSSGLKSPVSVHSNNENMSPKQLSSKNGVSKSQLPGTPTSCSPDDVFCALILHPHLRDLSLNPLRCSPLAPLALDHPHPGIPTPKW